MLNALTIDVEESSSIFSRDWLSIDAEPSDAVVRNMDWFLNVFSEQKIKATCFILGEVAKKFPTLVKRIVENGHEIASHGFSHKQIFKLTRNEFRREVRDSRRLLEDIISKQVLGYRAPAFSMMPHTKWALEILAEEGFEYDSSIYPFSGKRYGWPGFNKDICKIDLPNDKSIIEIPMSTVTLGNMSLPIAGGGYLRHFPYFINKLAINHIQKTRPVIVYLHPYAIETESRALPIESLCLRDQRKILRRHKIQTRNRDTMKDKIIKLLSDFRFSSVKEVIKHSNFGNRIS